MKAIWVVSFRHRSGRYYACDLSVRGKRVATVKIDVPRGTIPDAPHAFVEMLALQPEAR